MKEQLGNYKIIEQIDAGGDTIVYRALEEMGHNVTRPAAIKILQGVATNDTERLARLTQEVTMLLEVSSSPNIVTVYGFGIDEEEGPWIAMELAGKSLKHFLTDRPADPDQVRVLLRDCLRGLASVHGAEPTILHRDLKPNNILSTAFGTWQIADFGLAKRQNSDDTLKVATVKYAAPEMLDAELGRDSPRMDLYSLGMVAYEYALGRELFRQQFPSVYDPQASTSDKSDPGGDDRPKWMYWHTSMQMQAKPLHECIEGYPKELSDLVAAMMIKPVRDRIESARECLNRLGDVQSTVAAPTIEVSQEELPAAKGKSTTRMLVLAGIAAVLVIGTLAAMMLLTRTPTPVITLDQESYVAKSETLPITGVIANMPDRGSAYIRLSDNSTVSVIPDSDGKFSTPIRVRQLTPTNCTLTVESVQGQRLASKLIDIQRVAPEQVQIVVQTRPIVQGAEVVLTERENTANPIRLRTDDAGTCAAPVTHGNFELKLSHPRFHEYTNTFHTGDSELREIPVAVFELSAAGLEAARLSLIDEIAKIIEAAESGDPDAIAKLDEIQRKLGFLLPKTGGDRADLFDELAVELENVRKGDPSAASRIKEINARYQALADGSRAGLGLGPDVASTAGGTTGGATAGTGDGSPTAAGGATAPPLSKRGQLVQEFASLAAKAAAGDPQAQQRMAQIHDELERMATADLATSPELARAAEVRKLGTIADRALVGDALPTASLDQVQNRLTDFAAAGMPTEGNGLVDRIGDLAERAAQGDQAAISQLRRLPADLAANAPDTRDPDAVRREQVLDRIDSLTERAATGDQAAIRALQALPEQFRDAMGDTSPAAQAAVERSALIEEAKALEEAVKRGDPAAIARMAQIQQRLGQLAGDPSTPIGQQRQALLAEARALQDAVRRGDPAAIARMAEINNELGQLETLDAVASGSGPAAQRAALIAEAQSLEEAVKRGDPKAIARMAEINRQIGQLAAAGGGDPEVTKRRQQLVAEARALEDAVKRGDPAAIARMAEINGELAQLEKLDAVQSGGGVAGERAALLAEAKSLEEAVKRGDPQAIARMAQIQDKLGQLDDLQGAGATAGATAERARLIAEAQSLEEAVKRGDPQAIARMAQIQQRLGQIAAAGGDDPINQRRQELAAEAKSLEEAVRRGDPAAIARMQQINSELAGLETAPAVAALGGAAGERSALIAEAKSLEEAVKRGDPKAIARMAQIQQELGQLAAAGGDGAIDQRRSQLVAEAQALQEAVKRGDPAAIARLAQINDELGQLEQSSAIAAAGGAAGERASLIAEAKSLEEAVKRGDPQAIARMAQIQQRLGDIAQEGGNDPTNRRRQQLAAEAKALEEAVKNGDPQAIARMQQINDEMQRLEGTDALAGTDGERARLLAEARSLEDAVKAGDPKAIARMQQIQSRLQTLADASPDTPANKQREALLAEAKSLQEAVKRGDPKAIARMAEINAELGDIDRLEQVADAGAAASERAGLLAEAEALQEAVKRGDPQAIARLAQIQQRLGQIAAEGGDGAINERRQELLAEAQSLQEAVKRGDPKAIARMAQIQQELVGLETASATASAGGVAAERAQLLAEAQSLQEAVKRGDPQAIARMAQIQQQLGTLAAAEGNAAERDQLLAEAQSLQEAVKRGDPQAIARMAEIQQRLGTMAAAESNAAEREQLQAEAQSLQEAVKRGDPQAIARMAEIQQRLGEIGKDAGGGSERAQLLAEAQSLQEAVKRGDPQAIARMAQIQQQLGDIAAAGGTGGAVNERRQELIAEAQALQEAVKRGDPKAIARLAEINGELQQLETLDAVAATGGAAAERAQLLAEAQSLEEAVKRGDPQAIARMAEIQQQLGAIAAAGGDDATNTRRQELLAEAQALQEAVRRGDPQAIARMQQINAELVALESSAGGGDRAGLIAEAQALESGVKAGDAAAIERTGEIVAELTDLEATPTSAGDSKKEQLVDELADATQRLANGDLSAAADIERIQGELAKVEAQEAEQTPEARRKKILEEMASLTQRVIAGDPAAIARMKELQGELQEIAQSEAKESVAARRQELVSELKSLEAGVAAGDPDAIRRFAEIQKELKDLESGEAYDSKEAKRAALVAELGDLMELAAQGDPVAVARIKQIQLELLALEDSEAAPDLATFTGLLGGDLASSASARRESLIQELGEVTERALAGDEDAMKRLAEIQAELNGLGGAGTAAADDGAIGARRADLLAELAALQGDVAHGDLSALARIQQIQQELAALEAISASGGDADALATAADKMIGGVPALDFIDQATLLKLPGNYFRAFVELNVPTGALDLEYPPYRSRLRISGVLFNETERERLMARLKPALPRLSVELRVDPWAVCRRMEDRLARNGAQDVMVHAHLWEGDNILFVKTRPSPTLGHDTLTRIARNYVVDRDLLRVLN